MKATLITQKFNNQKIKSLSLLLVLIFSFTTRTAEKKEIQPKKHLMTALAHTAPPHRTIQLVPTPIRPDIIQFVHQPDLSKRHRPLQFSNENKLEKDARNERERKLQQTLYRHRNKRKKRYKSEWPFAQIRFRHRPRKNNY